MRYEGKTFTTTINLDGNEFKDCKFRSGVQYHGGDFKLEGVWDFMGADLSFHGSALATLNFLRLLRRVAGKDFIERMLMPPTN
ncbi:MAG TPA: hypothetical protein VJS37_12305 [Terriglobales bacterium]|nr:hypothetical protein [Terriglobales bacterium]